MYSMWIQTSARSKAVSAAPTSDEQVLDLARATPDHHTVDNVGFQSAV